ncbi:unnamed protein product, partial [Didymodactylos carnosus]
MFQKTGNIDFTSKDLLENINEVMAFCKQNCSAKCLSVLLYMSLRHFNVSCRNVDAFLSEIGGYRAATCHRQTDRLIHYGFEKFVAHARDGKRGDAFWDMYPNIEQEAREFSMEACTRKAASFTVEELAQFINDKYCEINGLPKKDSGYIRSVQSCRLDLKAWGITYSANKSRPYFLGHERPEVVEHREQIINYFLSREQFYYQVSEGGDPKWVQPSVPEPVVLLCHDESTFRSTEISHKRWMAEGHEPFFVK